MDRRRFVVSITTCAATAVAGCTGGDGEDGSTDSERAAEHYEAAIGYLEENADRLDEFAEAEEVPTSFDADAIERRADRADEELDEAERYTTDDHRPYVANARNVAAYQREAATYNELLVDLENCWDTVDSYIETDRWDDAADHFDECQDIVDELRSQFAETRDAFEEMDADLLEEGEGRLTYDEYRDEIALEEAELDVLVELMAGFDAFLDGVSSVLDGLESFQAERFSDARAAFEAGRRPLHSSADTFQRLEEDPETPDDVVPDMIELYCWADAFATATDHFVDAAAAAEREDWNAAEEAMAAGSDELGRCE